MTIEKRTSLSILLTVIGGITLVATLVSLWTTSVLLDSDRFTRHATEALDDEAVRGILASALADQIIAHGSAELMTVRPLLEMVIAQSIESRAFQAIYQPAVREMHASIFGGDDAIVLNIVDFMIVLSAAVESFDVELAARLPAVRSMLIDLRRRDFATGVIVFTNDVRPLSWLLLFGWVALHAAAVVVAPVRRRAIAHVGFAWTLAGTFVIIVAAIVRITLQQSPSDPGEARALVGLWRVFSRELVHWSLGFAVLGVALAAAASSAFRPVDVQADLDFVRRALRWSPADRWGQVGRSAMIVAIAWVLLRWPGQVVEGAVVAGGLYLLYIGLVDLIRSSGVGVRAEEVPGTPSAQRSFRRNLRAATARSTAVAGIAFLFGLAVLALVRAHQKQEIPVQLGEVTACNGHPSLCDRPLNEVVFAATHNSMSAAAEPGWFFASHERGIQAQLEYGIRAFLIDVYYGVPTNRGVRTDLFHDRDRDQLVAEYGEEFVAARDRMVERMKAADSEGSRAIYMCHGFCELGATPLATALRTIRDFLDAHPREVVILMIQDEVPADAVAAAFEDAGLVSYTYTHLPGASWPTLREMIEHGEQLLVMAENDGSGPAWYHAAFELTQETPYSFHSASEFSCELNRGQPDSPLFLLNHWIERVTPSPADADSVNRYDVLLRRALACQSQRGMVPNLVAVNFYGRGDVMRVVRTLNGVDVAYRD